MLTRLAKVVWWLGALFLLSAVGVQIAMQPPRPRVDPAGAYCAQVSRFAVEHGAVAPVAGVASKTLGQEAAEDAQQSALAECQAAALPQPVPIWNRSIGLVALGVPGLALWALAFILAGSFWRPPSTRSTSRALV